MSNYKFLRKEDDGFIYVVSESAIKPTPVNEIYDGYGQETGHYNAGSVICLLNAKAVEVANAWAEEKGLERTFKVQDNILAYDETSLFDYLLEKCEEDEDIDIETPIVDSIAYHDGHNWRSIVLSGGEEYGFYMLYEVIEGEEEEKLNKLLEEMEYTGDATGYKYWQSGTARVTQSVWQGDWELYTIEEDFYAAEETE